MADVVGWVGTGVMGAAMCRRLMERGHEIVIFNRTREKAQPLVDLGASWAANPAEVARGAKVVFTMVGFPSDVERVYQAEDGLLSGVGPQGVLVDMTTTKPNLAVNLMRAAEAKNARFVDAPVSGGDVGATNGTLSIMIGGDQTVVEELMPLFRIMGKNIVYQGTAGSGQHAKMCNQIAIAGTMIGVCESLIYGRRAGLDLNVLLQAIGSGAAGCWTLENLAPRILKRDFEPGFYIEHFIKDMEIALEEAARMDLSLPGLALVNQLYRAVKAQGHGLCGTQALILGLESLAAFTPEVV